MRAPLVPGVLCLAGGIALGVQRSVPLGDGPLLLALSVAAAVVAALLARPGRAGGTAWPVLALFVAAGGLLGVGARLSSERSCAAWLPSDLPVAVHGRLLEVAGDRLRLAVTAVEVGEARVACAGEVAGRVDGQAPGPGTAVIGRGRWWRAPGGTSLTPTGLLLLDRLETADGAGEGPGPGVIRTLRLRARDRVDRLFGERAPLAASLLLAQRDALDREVRERFSRAGLSHLLAISGLHVGLVAGILLLLGGVLRVGRPAGSLVAALGTVAYVAFLGAPHSATRAALQIVLVLAARAAQRPARTEALMAAAALALLAADPGALLSPGFQLSFAGVAGILVLRRPLLGRLAWLAGRRVRRLAWGRWLADGLATSVAATAATAPIVAWHFGRVAPVGIIANLVAIPLLSGAVPVLALALAADGVSAMAGRFLAGAGTALLDALDATARVAAGVPGGTVAVPASVALLVTAAIAAGWVATRRLGRARTGVRRLVWAAVAAAVLLVAPVRPTGDGIEIHVIDVGQGDAVALRSPAGRWILVDAGVATDSYDAGARLVVPYLARRGVRRLEGLVITHADADHMGGAGAVIRSLRPRWVADPGMVAPKAGYMELLRLAAERGIPWVAARRGMELDVDGMSVEVLYPAGVVASDDANDGSVVLRVVLDRFQALLTGDAPAAVELALVRRYGGRLEADVLKVGHHGSSTSTTAELLAAAGPSVALISAGRGNRYGHPHASVVRRLADAGIAIARTDRQGTLVVRGTAGGEVAVRVERGPGPF